MGCISHRFMWKKSFGISAIQVLSYPLSLHHHLQGRVTGSWHEATTNVWHPVLISICVQQHCAKWYIDGFFVCWRFGHCLALEVNCCVVLPFVDNLPVIVRLRQVLGVCIRMEYHLTAFNAPDCRFLKLKITDRINSLHEPTKVSRSGHSYSVTISQAHHHLSPITDFFEYYLLHAANCSFRALLARFDVQHARHDLRH